MRLNTRVTVGMVKEERPATVVMATGAAPLALSVSVISRKTSLKAKDVILGKVKNGARVVIVGGRHMGMEVADLIQKVGL